MTEDTKQFVIKVLTVGAVLVVLYFIFSPYRNCLREMAGFYENGPNRFALQANCQQDTNW